MKSRRACRFRLARWANVAQSASATQTSPPVRAWIEAGAPWSEHRAFVPPNVTDARLRSDCSVAGTRG